MATYLNDAIWRQLSEYYNVTPADAQVGDLYKRWLDEKGLNWGNVGDYFISQFPGVLNRGDAEWLFWTGGFGDDLVLLLNASQEPQTGTASQWVLNRADTRVPNAVVGLSGRAELRGVYHGLLLPGSVGNYASVPAASIGNPTSALDVRTRVQINAVTGVLADIVCKGFGVTSQAGYTIRQSGTNMTCFVSTAGTDFTRTLSAAHGMNIGDSAWFRMVYDGSTGQMWLYKAQDSDVEPDVWTLLASDQFTAGNVHASTEDLRVGVNSNNANPFTGAVKRVVVRHNLTGGTKVLDADFTKATSLASSFTATTGGTVTVTAASGVDSNDPVFLQHTGTNYVYFPGVSGNYASVPDSSDLDITGDIEIVVRVAMDNWAPASQSNLLSKWLSTGEQRSYQLYKTSTDIVLATSSDGTSANATFASVAWAGPANGTTVWVKATKVSATGVTTFSWAADQATEPSSWTPIGSVPVASASIHPGSALLEIGSAVNGTFFLSAMKAFRAIVRNGIGGTKVLDIDFTSGITNGNQTSFTAGTGQTVTINRSTSGKKTVAVTRPCWLFGTNSYMDVADAGLLDFGSTDSFTVLALIRQWGTPTSFGRYTSKRVSGGQGYELTSNGTNLGTVMFVQDDTNPQVSPVARPTLVAGDLSLVAGIVNRVDNTIRLSLGSTLSATTSVASVGSLSNAQPFRVGGASSGGGHQDFELFAVAVVRRPLSSTDLEGINEWFNPPSVVRVTGATTVESGDYLVHTFASSGTFTVEGAPLDVEYLVVAGGGGGGSGSDNVYYGGGGGAGGAVTNMGSPIKISSGTKTVVVGAGGAQLSQGSNSSFDSVTAIGGGRGNGPIGAGGNGGSGGGAGSNSVAADISGGSGTAGQGFGGGGSGFRGQGGGGGGAGGAGSNSANNSIPGNSAGGVGISNSITGVATFYAGGGSGGVGAATPATAGTGGGGTGGCRPSGVGVRATAGVDGLGGGGGGGIISTGGVNSAGAKGGNGVVIVRHKKTDGVVIR